MSQTPNYDLALQLINEVSANFERIGDAIADPDERLAYYAAIALNHEPERQMAQIRNRAERMARRGFRAALRSGGL